MTQNLRHAKLGVISFGLAIGVTWAISIALLAVMCLEVALPAGGRIVVRCDRGQWQLQAYGTKIRIEPAPWAFLRNPTADAGELAPAYIQFALLRDALELIRSRGDWVDPLGDG